jgi:hypothetical protein
MELNIIKMSFFDTMTPHRSSIDVYLFLACIYSECKSSHVIWYSLPLYAITNKTNKNVQRPHVFLYFSKSAAGTIAGAVIGSLIVIGMIISLIVYCAKQSNRSTGVIIHPTTSAVNTTQLSQQQQQQGIIQY